MNVLIALRLHSELSIAVELARRFRARGDNVVLSSEEQEGAARAIQRAAAREDCGYENLEARENAYEQSKNTAIGRLADRLGDLALRLVFGVKAMLGIIPYNFALSGRYRTFRLLFQRKVNVARRLLREHSIDAVIVFQDGISGNPALVKAGQDAGAKVIDCPYGFFTTDDFDDLIEEKVRHDDIHFVAATQEFDLAAVYPEWIRSSGQGDVLLFPWDWIQARKDVGLHLPHPWSVHGGNSDLVAAESKHSYDQYCAEGLNKTKLRELGTVYCDVLYEELERTPEFRRAHAEANKITPGETVVLVTVPPSYHDTRAAENEFDTYEQLCRALAHLSDGLPGARCIYSLHPNMPPAQVELMRGHGIDVSDEWVIRLIPQADIYFTTFSSTIRWAIACGKPVINYNAYGYNSTYYADVEAVYTISSFETTRAQLTALADDAEYARAAARQRTAGTGWGTIDGENFNRLYEAMSELVAS